MVAVALDEEHGDGLTCGRWVTDVLQEDAPAHGEDVRGMKAADVGARLLGEEKGHDLAAHGASGDLNNGRSGWARGGCLRVWFDTGVMRSSV